MTITRAVIALMLFSATVGDYRGERIEAEGSSADVAAKYWAGAARIKDD